MMYATAIRDAYQAALEDDEMSRQEQAVALADIPGIEPLLHGMLRRAPSRPESAEELLMQFGTERVLRALDALWARLEARGMVEQTEPASEPV